MDLGHFQLAGSRFMFWAVRAPMHLPLSNPEMTAALVGLSNRWLDGGSTEPVKPDRPAWAPGSTQGQLDLLSTAAGTPEARPFFDAPIPDDNQCVCCQGGGVGMCGLHPTDYVDAADDPAPGQKPSCNVANHFLSPPYPGMGQHHPDPSSSDRHTGYSRGFASPPATDQSRDQNAERAAPPSRHRPDTRSNPAAAR